MPTPLHKTQDAQTGEEIASTTIPPEAPAANGSPPKRNAFTALMTPKKPPSTDPMPPKIPPSSTPHTDPALSTTFLRRDGLGAYIASPSSFPSSRVIYHDDKWVLIRDLFPKSSIHLLLLPRDPGKQLLHPFEAFKDGAFLEEVKGEVRKVKRLVGKELGRVFGGESVRERERRRAVEEMGDDADEEEVAKRLPPARDWAKDVISGIHIGPSMNHLHIHILSKDMHSECMKHRKHYNSFQTPFLVDVEDFPLGEEDDRRHYGRERYLEWELKCWRCGRGFGNRFARLKEHLEGEFEEWRRE
ncbi:aprataxin-like protein [Lecanora helva]